MVSFILQAFSVIMSCNLVPQHGFSFFMMYFSLLLSVISCCLSCLQNHYIWLKVCSRMPQFTAAMSSYHSQYLHPYFPPWGALAAPSLNTHDFIPYQPHQLPITLINPFRVALGETTSQSVNMAQSMSAGNKQKWPHTGSLNTWNQSMQQTSAIPIHHLPHHWIQPLCQIIKTSPQFLQFMVLVLQHLWHLQVPVSLILHSSHNLGDQSLRKARISQAKPVGHLMYSMLCMACTPMPIQLHFQRQSLYLRCSPIHQVHTSWRLPIVQVSPLLCNTVYLQYLIMIHDLITETLGGQHGRMYLVRQNPSRTIWGRITITYGKRFSYWINWRAGWKLARRTVMDPWTLI